MSSRYFMNGVPERLVLRLREAGVGFNSDATLVRAATRLAAA